jgi:GDPmannose 4,6-dehydratase
MKKALICGVAGQDGSYLSQLLLAKGYSVVGTSRDAMVSRFDNLVRLGIRDRVSVVSMACTDFRSVISTLKCHAPDEVYYLAGQSSVGLSFEQPVETIESIAIGTLNLLEGIRFVELPARFYCAGSSECFGDMGDSNAASEDTPFRPRSPYAVAKATAHSLVSNYREAYGIFASTGILFNHESPLRPERFVTQKVVKAAARIAAGSKEELRLGDLAICRDWGWAPEYIEGMWRMLQMDAPDDFIIATGRTVSLEYFVNQAFAHFGLAWQDHVVEGRELLRPSDIRVGRANPSKAGRVLGWSPRTDVDGVVERMCRAAVDGS